MPITDISQRSDLPALDGGRLFTVAEIARLIGVSRPTVAAWITRGQLRATDLATGALRQYRVSEDDLRTFLAQRETRADAFRSRVEGESL
jgi:excisionase family DNA binding protein